MPTDSPSCPRRFVVVERSTVGYSSSPGPAQIPNRAGGSTSGCRAMGTSQAPRSGSYVGSATLMSGRSHSSLPGVARQ
jgi:hypothetical protein